jgi:hypothetical protein
MCAAVGNRSDSHQRRRLGTERVVINITGNCTCRLHCESHQIVEQHHRVTNNIYANQRIHQVQRLDNTSSGFFCNLRLVYTGHKLKYSG